nr:hypothetical protein Iba_chr15aCG10890 [Ipomoea batatas]
MPTAAMLCVRITFYEDRRNEARGRTKLHRELLLLSHRENADLQGDGAAASPPKLYIARRSCYYCLATGTADATSPPKPQLLPRRRNWSCCVAAGTAATYVPQLPDI